MICTGGKTLDKTAQPNIFNWIFVLNIGVTKADAVIFHSVYQVNGQRIK